MKIVCSATEGGPIGNARYEADDYALQPGEVVYSGTTIPTMTPLAVWQGGQIVDDSDTWAASLEIPLWGQDLISALTTNGTIKDTDLSKRTQNIINVVHVINVKGVKV